MKKFFKTWKKHFKIPDVFLYANTNYFFIKIPLILCSANCYASVFQKLVICIFCVVNIYIYTLSKIFGNRFSLLFSTPAAAKDIFYMQLSYTTHKLQIKLSFPHNIDRNHDNSTSKFFVSAWQTSDGRTSKRINICINICIFKVNKIFRNMSTILLLKQHSEITFCETSNLFPRNTFPLWSALEVKTGCW